jgi:hypothetical protein
MSAKRINVLLVSKSTNEALKLKKDLSDNPKYRVNFVETADEAMILLTAGNIDCSIFNLENFGWGQAKLVKGIREVTKVFQIVIFADTTDEEAVISTRLLDSVVVVEKALLNVERDLSGLCGRLVEGFDITTREAKRLPTNQRVRVQLGNGRHYDGMVRDISVKGACIELSTSSIQVGDIITVTIYLEKLSRQHLVTAEIRWKKTWPGRGIFGLRFTKPLEKEILT